MFYRSGLAHEGDHLSETFDADLALFGKHVAFGLEEKGKRLLSDFGWRVRSIDDRFDDRLAIRRVANEFEGRCEAANIAPNGFRIFLGPGFPSGSNRVEKIGHGVIGNPQE